MTQVVLAVRVALVSHRVVHRIPARLHPL